MLEVWDIHTYYGQSHILFGVSLEVTAGEVVCLLGRNGAGKTTTLRSIMGLTPPRSGRIRFRGEEIAGKPSHVLARKGLGYVPEDRRIFPDLTVVENLEIARKSGQGDWTPDRVFSLFPQLEGFKSRKGSTLSGGEQQMLTIARTLMGNPALMLLDEPCEGLAPVVMETLLEQLKGLKKQGLTILLSEQNLAFATELADRVYIIDKGQICYQGAVQAFQANEQVRNDYLAV